MDKVPEVDLMSEVLQCIVLTTLPLSVTNIPFFPRTEQGKSFHRAEQRDQGKSRTKKWTFHSSRTSPGFLSFGSDTVFDQTSTCFGYKSSPLVLQLPKRICHIGLPRKLTPPDSKVLKENTCSLPTIWVRPCASGMERGWTCL